MRGACGIAPSEGCPADSRCCHPRRIRGAPGRIPGCLLPDGIGRVDRAIGQKIPLNCKAVTGWPPELVGIAACPVLVGVENGGQNGLAIHSVREERRTLRQPLAIPQVVDFYLGVIHPHRVRAIGDAYDPRVPWILAARPGVKAYRTSLSVDLAFKNMDCINRWLACPPGCLGCGTRAPSAMRA